MDPKPSKEKFLKCEMWLHGLGNKPLTGPQQDQWLATFRRLGVMDDELGQAGKKLQDGGYKIHPLDAPGIVYQMLLDHCRIIVRARIERGEDWKKKQEQMRYDSEPVNENQRLCRELIAKIFKPMPGSRARQANK